MAWYHHFFEGLPQQAWKAAQTAEQTQLELELVIDTLAFGPGDAVLDIFCGYGRHAIPLARLGAKLTGVDISADYTDELTQAAAKAKLPIRVVTGDFLGLPLAEISDTETFTAAYCLGNSFSFFDHSDMLAFLTRIARLLQPGGRLLVHTEMLAESVLPDYQPRNWMPIETPKGSLLFMVENDYQPLQSCIDSHLTYVYEGRTETRTARHYIYTLAELVRLFEQAGFEMQQVLGTEHGDSYQVGDAGAWLLAQKA